MVFSFTPRDRIKCDGRLIKFGKLGYANQIGLVSVCARFQLLSLSRSDLKVPGGRVWWCGVVEAHFSVLLKPKPS